MVDRPVAVAKKNDFLSCKTTTHCQQIRSCFFVSILPMFRCSTCSRSQVTHWGKQEIARREDTHAFRLPPTRAHASACSRSILSLDNLLNHTSDFILLSPLLVSSPPRASSDPHLFSSPLMYRFPFLQVRRDDQPSRILASANVDPWRSIISKDRLPFSLSKLVVNTLPYFII